MCFSDNLKTRQIIILWNWTLRLKRVSLFSISLNASSQEKYKFWIVTTIIYVFVFRIFLNFDIKIELWENFCDGLYLAKNLKSFIRESGRNSSKIAFYRFFQNLLLKNVLKLLKTSFICKFLRNKSKAQKHFVQINFWMIFF